MQKVEGGRIPTVIMTYKHTGNMFGMPEEKRSVVGPTYITA